MTKEEFLEALFAASDPTARRDLIAEHPEFLQLEAVYALKEQADHLEWDDANRALHIGLVAEELAEWLSSAEAHAVALWIQANAHDFLAEHESAVRCYERAAELFNAAGKPLEAARTAIGQISTLMQLGQFDQCQHLAQSARGVFAAEGDVLSLAKLDMNLGNLHYQRGQYAQALEAFERATEAFISMGETFYGAMNQINQANALLPLDNFLLAEQLHAKARPVFDTADLRTVAASVDHDLALLQYARGDYAEAFRTFERARSAFSSLSLDASLAMTDLEESDIYLDLNLPEEALRLAQQAEGAFSKMGMALELARAHTNHAIALARLNQRDRAIPLLDEARSLFLSQTNEAWATNIDLQRAEIIGQEGQREQARLLAGNAAEAYAAMGMKTKQVYARILIANLWADDRQWGQTMLELQKAHTILGNLCVPWLEQRMDTCMGRVYEGAGEAGRAIESYQNAARHIEQMTSAITAEEHRTAFVADKLAPYEALVTLYGESNPTSAFQWAEQAKARALIDLLAAGVRPRLHLNDEMDARQAERLEALREELNWLYTRLTRGANPDEAGVPAAGPETWEKIQQREREATSLWRNLQARHAEKLSLIRTIPLELSEIQASLPAKTALVEYFIARGQVMAFVITPGGLHIYPALVSLADLLPLMENLTFQFSKFQYGAAYYQRHRQVLLNTTQEILAQFGQRLIIPLREILPDEVEALIIVPHGPLHALPFQALRIDDHYLIEEFAISYAPSAAVLKFCWDKPARSNHQKPFSGRPLLVGISDERTYHVAEEIQALAKLLEDAETLLEQQATFDEVTRLASSSGLIHLATHGLFRPDAPLLSSIRLADRWLAVQDVYNLELNAELVVLSACETGLGHDAGGDDLVGLVRGFLHAGAHSLLVSLWTVDDESMIHLITHFYHHWLAGKPKNQALRQAQLELLTKYEHPFYWAPLVLIGNEN